MHNRILAVLILTGNSLVDRDFPVQPFDDHVRRSYVAMITLPSDPSLTKSQKMEKCHKLDNMDAKSRPSDVTEDQLCEHIVKFNEWLSEQIKDASKKVRDVYEKTHEWSTYAGQKLEDPVPQDNLTDTLNNAEKEEFAKLEDRIAEKVEENEMLKLHRFMTIAP